MVRSIIGIIVGVLVGGLVVGLIELPGMLVHPPPPGFDPKDTQAVAEFFASVPASLKLMVVIAWAVGPFVAALVCCRIAKRACLAHAAVIGGIFVLLVLMNLVSFPHPWWMWAGGLIAPLVTAMLAGKLAQRLWPTGTSGPQVYDMREKGMAC